MTAGDNIRILRLKAGLTQRELAAMAGISSVRMIESGARAGWESTLRKIATALGVTIADLYAEPKPKGRKIRRRRAVWVSRR